MNKSEINKLFVEFQENKNAFLEIQKKLADALDTPETRRIVSKKTRGVFRRGQSRIYPSNLYDDVDIFNLFNMLMLLDILDGSYVDPDVECECDSFDDEPLVTQDEVDEIVVEETVVLDPIIVTDEMDADRFMETVKERIDAAEATPEPVYEAPSYTPEPEPVRETPSWDSGYSRQESSYESSSSSYESSSSSYDSGGSSYDSGGCGGCD